MLFLLVMNKKDNPAPHYTGHRKRLIERYSKTGIDSLNDYEALELLLMHTIPRKDVKPLAKELLNCFGNIQSVLDSDIDDLKQVKGIGERSALLIKLVKDFGVLYLRERDIKRKRVVSPKDIVDYLRGFIGAKSDELFLAIYLNTNNEVLGEAVISEGTINQTTVYPRKVFEKALRIKALFIILIHNHPGGNLTPSKQDIELTKQLKTAGESLGIIIRDHLIITKDNYLSFFEKGLM